MLQSYQSYQEQPVLRSARRRRALDRSGLSSEARLSKRYSCLRYSAVVADNHRKTPLRCLRGHSFRACVYHFGLQLRILAPRHRVKWFRMVASVARDSKVSRCEHPLTEACTRMAANGMEPVHGCNRLRGGLDGPGRCRANNQGHAIKDAVQNILLVLRGRGRLHLHEPAQEAARQIIPFCGKS